MLFDCQYIRSPVKKATFADLARSVEGRAADSHEETKGNSIEGDFLPELLLT